MGRCSCSTGAIVSTPQKPFGCRSSSETVWGSILAPRAHGDPYEYVLSVNAHRRHLTPEQKREVIAKILQARPEKSDRQIAKQVKVDHKTVGAVRGKQEDVGKIPHVEKRTDTRGRAQPARKPTTANGNARATTRKPTMKKSGSSGLLNSLAWSDASVAQRTRFLDAVGVKTVWDAMSPSMKDAVRELANVKPPEPMKPAPSNARPDLAIPADGSITEFLKRA